MSIDDETAYKQAARPIRMKRGAWYARTKKIPLKSIKMVKWWMQFQRWIILRGVINTKVVEMERASYRVTHFLHYAWKWKSCVCSTHLWKIAIEIIIKGGNVKLCVRWLERISSLFFLSRFFTPSSLRVDEIWPLSLSFQMTDSAWLTNPWLKPILKNYSQLIFRIIHLWRRGVECGCKCFFKRKLTLNWFFLQNL